MYGLGDVYLRECARMALMDFLSFHSYTWRIIRETAKAIVTISEFDAGLQSEDTGRVC
jgi:hypothetical protein